MSYSDDTPPMPKSMRHRRILDAAAEEPDASMQELADIVPTATTDLVERVLETYGDPAAEDDSSLEAATTDGSRIPTGPKSSVKRLGEPPRQATDGSGTESSTNGDRVECSTNGEGVERSTNGEGVERSTNGEGVERSADDGEEGSSTSSDGTDGSADEKTGRASNGGGSKQPQSRHARHQSVDEGTGAQQTGRHEDDSSGGDYPPLDELTPKQREVLRTIADRPEATQRELAGELGVSASTVSNHANSIEGFDWGERQSFVEAVFGTDLSPSAMTDDTGTDHTDIEATFEAFDQRLSALERQLENLSGGTSEPTFNDPDLAHKVVHACLCAENISEEEELQILRIVLATG